MESLDNTKVFNGLPLMTDAYAIGEQIEEESKFLFECTKASLPLTKAGSACVLFKTKVDEGIETDVAWKQAISLYNYLCKKSSD